MKIRFQYVDWTEWESHPSEASNSPDKGVVRMFAIDDEGRTINFVYDDVYYVYEDKQLGGWRFGSGTVKREFVLKEGSVGSETIEIPIELPESAVVRLGETVSDEEAVKFGLIKKDEPYSLRPKKSVKVKRCGCGEN